MIYKYIVLFLYWVIVKWVSLTLSIFFREIKIIGRENIPSTGVVLAGNHANMAVDGWILATSCGRLDGHFWIKGTAFKGLFGKFIRMMGAIPVNRKQDIQNPNQPIDNTSLFEESIEILKDGGAFMIFPEGTSYTEPHIIPLKTGIARLVIGLYQKYKIKVPIVPSGINYTRKDKFRSRVLVKFGEPIYLNEEYVKNPEEGIDLLMKEIESGIKSVTINAPDWETMKLVNTCKSIYTTELRGSLTLEEDLEFTRRFSNLYQKFENSQQMQSLRKDLEGYQIQLDNFGIQDDYFSEKLKKRQTIAVLLLRILQFLLFGLLAFPGVLIHSPLYIMARIANRMTPYQESKAMMKLFVLFITVPTYYLVVSLIVGFWYGRFSMLQIACVLPFFGIFHIYCLEQGFASARNILSLFRRLGLALLSKKHTEYILKQREDISQKLKQLAQQYKEALDQEQIPIVEGSNSSENTKQRLRKFLRGTKDELYI